MEDIKSIGLHPSFKTVHPVIIDVEVNQDLLRNMLSHQYRFYRRTSPFEFKQWNNEDFQNFEVKLQDIDRLYYMDSTRQDSISNYRVTFRIRYKENLYYVDLNTCSHRKGFDIWGARCMYITREPYIIWGAGCMYITREPYIFTDLIVESLSNKHYIYRSLQEDGIQVDTDDEDTSKYCRSHTRYVECHCQKEFKKKSAQSLKFLCHKPIFQYKERLQDYSSILPRTLTASIDKFIRLEEAKKVYRRL